MEIDHLTVFVRDYDTSKPLYEEVLAPLGLVCQLDWPDERRAYFGQPGEPSSLWLVESELAGRLEIALPAPDAGAVHSFYGTAIAAGARAEWEPGVRPEYNRDYSRSPRPRLRRELARGRVPRRRSPSRRVAPYRRGQPGGVAPLAGTLGIELTQADAEEVRGGMDWAPERCTAGGVLHGGALMAFADTLGGVCAFLNLPDGATTTATVESKTNFFRAVREGRVEGVTRPLHVGRSFIVVQTDLLDAEERRVAQVTQTQAVLS